MANFAIRLNIFSIKSDYNLTTTVKGIYVMVSTALNGILLRNLSAIIYEYLAGTVAVFG